jgi:hypothetical protein
MTTEISNYTVLDYRFSTVNGILKHFLEEPKMPKKSIESKVEGIAIKVFFGKGKWLHFCGKDGYIRPKLIVVPDTPKIREVFNAEIVQHLAEPKVFSWSSVNFERKIDVFYELEFLASEKDVALDYRGEEEKKPAKQKKN